MKITEKRRDFINKNYLPTIWNNPRLVEYSIECEEGVLLGDLIEKLQQFDLNLPVGLSVYGQSYFSLHNRESHGTIKVEIGNFQKNIKKPHVIIKV